MSFQSDLISALPLLSRYTLSLTREPDAARDLVQSTALRALSSVAPPAGQSLLPWLIRVARNAFIDERRRAAQQEQIETVEEIIGDRDGGTRALAVRQALARLDPISRNVVTLVDIEGLTYREAAVRLAVPVGTVMSRLSRARRQLVVLLADDEGGTSEPSRS